MGFLLWHYTEGVNFYLKRWYFSLGWILHFFSLTVLIRSIFSPWKRLTIEDDRPGFRFEAWFQKISYNLISRWMGFIVRSALILCCLLLLIPAFVLGVIGFIFWIFIPPIGLTYYFLHDRGQKKHLSALVRLVRTDPPRSINLIFESKPGKFLLSHMGIQVDDLVTISSTSELDWTNFEAVNFSDFIQKLIDSSVWKENKLRSIGVSFHDLLLGANWWDSHLVEPEDLTDKRLRFSRPGLGLELLFGYTPQLNQFATDLSLPQSYSHHLIGREALVSRIERALSGGVGVILTGQPGVGKKTVILEFARRCMAGELSPKMIYKRVLEFDYNFLLSESLDLNQKKAKLSTILREAVSAGNIILVIKDLHRLTRSDVEGLDFTDLFEQFLEKKQIKIIGISSQSDYDRFISTNSRLKKFFEVIEAVPSTKEEAMKILIDSAHTWEVQKRIIITTQSLRAIIDGSEKYVTDTPFPEKALEILDHALSYIEKTDLQSITADVVNTVLSEQTGISLARLTEKERETLGNLEDILHKRLIGQNAAVSLVAKSLRARSVGAKDENRPIGSFLFLGPTGVGKTETAKALAEVYYGSEKNILRFDMAEFIGEEGLSRLIGSASRNQPGLLTTAIKSHPASLLLLDEIEKASREIFNLFLSLLDEGVITDAFGKQIICRHLFVIATSNAGAEQIRELVNANVKSKELQKQVVEFIQQSHSFSPEFLNRFDGVVVFEPLTKEELGRIAKLQLKSLQKNLVEKNITLTVSDSAAEKLVELGFQPEFGARPMRRIVDMAIGDVIGKAILNGTLIEGDKATLIADDSEDGFSLEAANR